MLYRHKDILILASSPSRYRGITIQVGRKSLAHSVWCWYYGCSKRGNPYRWRPPFCSLLLGPALFSLCSWLPAWHFSWLHTPALHCGRVEGASVNTVTKQKVLQKGLMLSYLHVIQVAVRRFPVRPTVMVFLTHFALCGGGIVCSFILCLLTLRLVSALTLQQQQKWLQLPEMLYSCHASPLFEMWMMSCWERPCAVWELVSFSHFDQANAYSASQHHCKRRCQCSHFNCRSEPEGVRERGIPTGRARIWTQLCSPQTTWWCSIILRQINFQSTERRIFFEDPDISIWSASLNPIWGYSRITKRANTSHIQPLSGFFLKSFSLCFFLFPCSLSFHSTFRPLLRLKLSVQLNLIVLLLLLFKVYQCDEATALIQLRWPNPPNFSPSPISVSINVSCYLSPDNIERGLL